MNFQTVFYKGTYVFIINILIVFCLSFLIVNCTTNQKISSEEFKIDKRLSLIVVLRDTITVEQPYSQIKLDKHTFRLLDTSTVLTPGQSYQVEDKKKNKYALFLSSLPVLSVTYKDHISYSNYTPAKLTIREQEKSKKSYVVGSRIRGAFTLQFPKKSLRLEVWEDTLTKNSLNTSLLDLRLEDDWVLQAMYNEPLRLRDKVGHELWYTLLSHRDSSKKHIETRYIEVFFQNQYQGVYVLSERIDQKLLNISDEGLLVKAKEWGGVNGKNTTEFEASPNLPDKDTSFWGGYKHKYPKKEYKWELLKERIDFVAESPNRLFYDSVSSYFSIDNLIDYYIFINILASKENVGKNLFIAQAYDNAPYYFVPWDLDAIFGNTYDGTRDETVDTSIMSNYLMHRMFNVSESPYIPLLKKRWNDLIDANVITSATIFDLIKFNYIYLDTQGAYKREQMKWEEFDYSNQKLNELENWLSNRITFLDNYINQL